MSERVEPTGVDPPEVEPAGGVETREDRPPTWQTPAGRAEPRPARPPWYRRALIPVLAVLTALAVGALVIIFTDPDVLRSWTGFFRHPGGTLALSWQIVRDSYQALFVGAFGSPSQIWRAIASADTTRIASAFYPLSETFVIATPLIFAGLALAVGFRAGLFNIGAEGQIVLGAIVGAMVAFSFPGVPGPVHVVLVVLAGFVGGAMWGAIPGFLKAKTGAHEVITTIMLNYVAYRLLDYVLSIAWFRPPGRNDPLSRTSLVAFPHLFGSNVRIHAGFLLALAVAAAVAFLLNRTTSGFEFQAVGANPDAARAAGMSPTRTFITVMALSGGLAGLAGANQLLSTSPQLTPGFSSQFGFDAIALALLGRSRPWGVVAASILFGALRAGSRNMQAATATPVDIVVVIQALVIVFVAAPELIRAIYRIKVRREEAVGTLTKGWGS